MGEGGESPPFLQRARMKSCPECPGVLPALGWVSPCLHQCFLNVHEHLHVPVHPGGILQVKPPPVKGNDSQILTPRPQLPAVQNLPCSTQTLDHGRGARTLQHSHNYFCCTWHPHQQQNHHEAHGEMQLICEMFREKNEG